MTLRVGVIKEKVRGNRFKLPQLCHCCGKAIEAFPFVRKFSKGGRPGKSYHLRCAERVALL